LAHLLQRPAEDFGKEAAKVSGKIDGLTGRLRSLLNGFGAFLDS
jgi:hypothetical protein